MATTKHKAYANAAATILTTELNSLANSTFGTTSAAYDNSSLLDLFDDFELQVATQGSARSTGAQVELYIVRSLDGTNYDRVVRGITQPIVVWSLDAATTATRITGPGADVPIPPGLFKVTIYNATGQAFASSGNIVSHRPHSIETA